MNASSIVVELDGGILVVVHDLLGAVLKLRHILEFYFERGEHGTAFQGCGTTLARAHLVQIDILHWAEGLNIAH